MFGDIIEGFLHDLINDGFYRIGHFIFLDMDLRFDADGGILWHLHLLPGTDSGGHGQRPENKVGDRTGGSFINLSSDADFHVHGVFNLMKDTVKGCRNCDKFAPSAELFDLKQSAAIFGLKPLPLKTFVRKPTPG